MRLIVAKIKNNIFPIIIILISLLIIFQSYAPDTILSGWDTLHPEFDFSIYFKRIFSVWQSHQGLGAPPAQSHLGDLPHAIILWLLSFFLPITMLRYVFILSMLIIGPLGVYFFLKDNLFHKNNNGKVFASIGALFYLLNLTTLQNFYTPLEMFAVFYGFLGWFFWVVQQFIVKNIKKNLIFLTIITLLLTPSSHTATLWYIFYFFFILFLFASLLINHFPKKLTQISLFLIIYVFIINSFWILPNIYYVFNHSSEVRLSKTHRLLSNEFFLKSQKRGTIQDLVLGTNFPFDWSIYDFEKKIYVPEMEVWNNHINNPLVKTWGYFVYLIFLAGVVLAFKKKQKLLLSFTPIILLCLFFLRNANFPFTHFFLFLRDYFGFFSEILRFPFTKFSLMYFFLFSIFAAYALSQINDFLEKKFSRKIVIYLFIIVASVQMLFMQPAFETGYLSPKMKVTIPRDYFQLFELLKNNPSKRILSLPLYNESGWVYHDWGYQGAGFLWFGIDNPLLDREFDRWYHFNEQAYQEFSHALYSNNSLSFSNLLNKYRIEYLLIDHSTTNMNQKTLKQIAYIQESEKIIKQIPSASLYFRTGFLDLYRIDKINQDIEIITNLPKIAPVYRNSLHDQAYEDYTDYISTNNQADIIYPFRSYLNERGRLNQSAIDIIQNDDNFSSKKTFILGSSILESIGKVSENNFTKETTPDFIQYISTDQSISSQYLLDSLDLNQTYIMKVVSQNLSGLPLRICLRNLVSYRCDINDELSKNNQQLIEDYFLIPPINQDQAYKIEVSNVSLSNLTSENKLFYIEIIHFPYESLIGLQSIQTDFIQNNVNKFRNYPEFIKNSLGYQVKIDSLPEQTATLVLNQAYEKNWKAYAVKNTGYGIWNSIAQIFPFLFGQELKEHVLVNNWANGWNISSGVNIVIVFLPQYLEFIGFGLLTLAFIYLLKYQS